MSTPRWLVVSLGLLFLLGAVLGVFWPPVPAQAGDFILVQLRIPRLVVGLMIGGTLGLSGAAYQALFQNPLATPSTTGTLAGATLGALIALLVGFEQSVQGLPWVTALSLLFGLLASALVVVAAVTKRARLNDVLLIGVAVTLATSALSTALQDWAEGHVLIALGRWSLGSLAQIGYQELLLTAPVLLLVWAILLSQARPLQVLVLGEALARTRGVRVVAVRTTILAASAVGVAVAVALTGPIAFVGLIVPQLVRVGLGARQSRVLLGSWVLGALFLAFADLVGRLVPRELPVGVVTAVIGAPVLAVMVLSRAKPS